MEKYYYSADGGSILLGNDDFTCCYTNGFGDGTFAVYVVERGEKSTRSYNFKGAVAGTFNVYGYDCDKDEILTTLTGRFGVYAKDGTIILERWD